MTELSFLYSPLLLIPGALLLVLGIYFFYFRRRVYSKEQTWILAGLRFIALFSILFFLLRPFLLQRESYSIKPRLVWLEDVSKSMKAHADSLGLDSNLRDLQVDYPSLNEKFEQSYFSFSKELQQDSFVDQSFTNIYRALSATKDRFYGEPLAGIVLISDGIYNRGINPLQAAQDSAVPIYSLMHGNRERQRDLALSALRYNKSISLDRILNLELDLKAQNAEGETFELLLYNADNAVLRRVPFQVNRKDWYESLLLEIPCPELGLQNYRVSIQSTLKEDNVQNNNREIGFEVVEEAYQTVIYSKQTHPDVNAIRRALGSNPNWELTYHRDLNSIDFTEVKLFVAFDWDADLLQNLEEKKIPSLFFIRANSSKEPFPELDNLENEGEEQFGEANTDLGLFAVSKDFKDQLSNWPPLTGVYGQIQKPLWAETVLFKRIGDLALDESLAFTGSKEGRRLGFFLGQGFWSWRVYNYRYQENTQAFDGFFKAWADYLMAQERKEALKIEFEEEIFADQTTRVLAKLYDASDKLVNSTDLNLALKRKDGLSYDFEFSRESNFYRLNMQGLEPGFYQYEASTRLGEREYKSRGRIWVRINALEQQDLQARRDMLQILAERTGGKAYELDDWQDLISSLKDSQAVGLLAERKIKQELLSKWWLFFVILSCLSAEWFLRKLWGFY